ncbi:hypothetical protein [Olivibacter domesticus]|uniref:Glycosyl hydrolase catalytic core n=1 Tax=Olivibacter domesticus TaxID=407022 RepID=A0A1H7GK95_OLID1|nr:hypothetical protein [Olivibacter domesticus]SEK37957.1 hypothetical protein SAMN05661044_00097 [Olivibacter domesticus]
MIFLEKDRARGISLGHQEIENVYVGGTKVFPDQMYKPVIEQLGFAVYATTNRAMGGGNTKYTKALTQQAQMNLLKECRARWCRATVYPKWDGDLNNTPGNGGGNYGNFITRYTNWINLCVQNNIKVSTCVIDSLSTVYGNIGGGTNTTDINSATATDKTNAYNAGFLLGSGFMSRYGYLQLRPVIELSNEIELFRDILREGNTGGGLLASDYFPNKVAVAVSYFKGMAEGIKSINPDTIITTPASSGYKPLYLYDLLINEIPIIDWVNWHWYSDMQANVGAGNFPNTGQGVANIFDFLYMRWGKPLIMTEMNQRGIGYNGAVDGPESGDLHQDKQVAYWNKMLPLVLERSFIKAAICYAQLSDPYNSSSVESTYGVYYFPGLDTSLPPGDQDLTGLLTPKKVVSFFKEYVVKGRNGDI